MAKGKTGKGYRQINPSFTSFDYDIKIEFMEGSGLNWFDFHVVRNTLKYQVSESLALNQFIQNSFVHIEHDDDDDDKGRERSRDNIQELWIIYSVRLVHTHILMEVFR